MNCFRILSVWDLDPWYVFPKKCVVSERLANAVMCSCVSVQHVELKDTYCQQILLLQQEAHKFESKGGNELDSDNHAVPKSTPEAAEDGAGKNGEPSSRHLPHGKGAATILC